MRIIQLLPAQLLLRNAFLPEQLLGGNPARVIGYVDDLVEKRVNFKEPFWNSTRAELENFYF